MQITENGSVDVDLSLATLRIAAGVLYKCKLSNNL